MPNLCLNNWPLVGGQLWWWGASWRGGSRKLTRLASIARLKMEDVCILCNVIDNFEPCPHMDKDCNIKSQLLKSFILLQPISLMKMFRLFRLKRVFLMFKV
jgi:hypothetical protein